MLDGVLGYSSLCMGAAQQTEKATGNGFKGGKMNEICLKSLVNVVNCQSEE